MSDSATNQYHSHILSEKESGSCANLSIYLMHNMRLYQVTPLRLRRLLRWKHVTGGSFYALSPNFNFYYVKGVAVLPKTSINGSESKMSAVSKKAQPQGSNFSSDFWFWRWKDHLFQILL